MVKPETMIPHSRPTLDASDAAIVADAVIKGHLATGHIVSQFNASLSAYIGTKHAMTVPSGSTALYLALRVMGVSEGSQVILPSYACASVLNAALLCRAIPVLVDINGTDYNISLKDTIKKVNKKTAAIIAPHLFGKPIKDIRRFLDLGVPIIEDCAMSIGAIHGHQKLGTFGKVSTFSFYATKMVTAGFGGALLTDDDALQARLTDMTHYDKRERWGEHANYGFSDINAALALNQLQKLQNFIQIRQSIAHWYTEFFTHHSVDFKLPNSFENIFYRYVIEHSESDELIKYMRDKNINVARPVFKCLHSYLNLPDSDFPNSAKAYQNAVSIPLYPSLTDAEKEWVAAALLQWVEQRRIIQP